MTLVKPTKEVLVYTAKSLNIELKDNEVPVYLNSLDSLLDSFNQLAECDSGEEKASFKSRHYTLPDNEDNPYNAWQSMCHIQTSTEGVLSSKTIAIKDNICVGGLPMTNGSSVLSGYIADEDAEVVKRVLEQGAIIKGKANCEYLCLSGGSHTCVTGPVLNPHHIDFSAGGSSSGCGAALAAGDVDLAIGCDQGGSVRIPGSFSGVVAMKPTHGLIPYTGIMPIELTLDTVGPMSRTVKDNALLMQVLAGKDGLDPRQYELDIKDYSAKLEDSLEGLKIGILKEAFMHENAEDAVTDTVMHAADTLEHLGATVELVSVPYHHKGLSIWLAIAVEGLMNMMMNGNGYNWRGLYLLSLSDKVSAWRDMANQFSPSLKSTLIAAQYLHERYHGRFYAKAQNLSRQLKTAYKNAFEKYDVLLMPTTPMKATPLPDVNNTEESLLRSNEMLSNTAPFNVTGQPAITLPCGEVNGLPVGMMLVADDYQEDVLYQVAHQYEKYKKNLKTNGREDYESCC